jgi:predicted DNA-binding mobile mystery protein A
MLVKYFIYNIKGCIMSWEKDLKIKQVDEMITTLITDKYSTTPKGGWLKLIRTTLGMSARALGERVDLTQSRIALIEKGEVDATITLHTLEKVAGGLECKLVYFLIPKEKSLAALREKQAYKNALALDSYAERHMALEDQATSKSYQQENIEKLKDEYLRNWPQNFWDKK